MSHFVQILRPESDCTNDGVTAHGKGGNALLLDPGEAVPDLPKRDPPLPRLRAVPWYGYFKAVPIETPKGMAGPMFGGNFVETSDSRFSAKYPHPIPVHDRFESVARATNED